MRSMTQRQHSPMLDALVQAVERVRLAETLAPAGSYEHGQYVGAALLSAWPVINAYVIFNRQLNQEGK